MTRWLGVLVVVAGAVTWAMSAAPSVTATSTPAQQYRLLGADGGIFAFNASYRGGLGEQTLTAPVVAVARNPSGDGYWIAAEDGGIFAFGDADFHGAGSAVACQEPDSCGIPPHPQDVVSIAAHPHGRGYWTVTSSGRVYNYGSAVNVGDLGGRRLTAPLVDILPTPTGAGYWLLGRDGGVYTFGDAPFHGASTGRHRRHTVAIAAGPGGAGYWTVTADGRVDAHGTAPLGDLAGRRFNDRIIDIVPTQSGGGYWLVSADGGVFSFGDAQFLGSAAELRLNAPITGAAG